MRAMVAGTLVAAGALAGAPASAGGLLLYEIGTEDVGLASAGYTARAQDASTVFTNPAGMTRLEGSQFDRGRAGVVRRSRLQDRAGHVAWIGRAAMAAIPSAGSPAAARSTRTACRPI